MVCGCMSVLRRIQLLLQPSPFWNSKGRVCSKQVNELAESKLHLFHVKPSERKREPPRLYQ